MTELKAQAAERYLAQPEPERPICLIHGPDPGLVSERGKQMVRAVLGEKPDSFALTVLDSDTLRGDPRRLIDEARTVGLFGGKRLIRVRITDPRPLVKAIEPVLDTPLTDTFVLLEAGDLKKGQPLRKRIESSKTAVAMACYADAQRDLDRLIDTILKDEGFRIDRDAHALLRAHLGANRSASRGEIEKLALYAQGRSSISAVDVEAIVSDASSSGLDDVIDASFTGLGQSAVDSLSTALDSGIAPAALTAAFQRHAQALHQARAEVERGRTPQDVVSTMRPPIFFRRRDSMAAALGLWTAGKLEVALALIADASRDVRLRGDLDAEIVSMLVLRLSSMSRR